MKVLDDRIRYRRKEWLVKFVGDPQPRWLTYDRINTGGINDHWREYEDRPVRRAEKARERRARRGRLPRETTLAALASVEDTLPTHTVRCVGDSGGYRWSCVRVPPRWLVIASAGSTVRRLISGHLRHLVHLTIVEADSGDPSMWGLSRAYAPHYFDMVWVSPPALDFCRVRAPYDRSMRQRTLATLDTLRSLAPARWIYEHPRASGYMLTAELLLEHLLPVHTTVIEESTSVHLWSSSDTLIGSVGLLDHPCSQVRVSMETAIMRVLLTAYLESTMTDTTGMTPR